VIGFVAGFAERLVPDPPPPGFLDRLIEQPVVVPIHFEAEVAWPLAEGGHAIAHMAARARRSASWS